MISTYNVWHYNLHGESNNSTLAKESLDVKRAMYCMAEVHSDSLRQQVFCISASSFGRNVRIMIVGLFPAMVLNYTAGNRQWHLNERKTSSKNYGGSVVYRYSPLYSFTYHSTKPPSNQPLPLSANLPTWSASPFAGTLTALSGATNVTQHTGNAAGKQVGGGTDRAVIQMIANASLDVIEESMRTNNAMYLKNIDKFNEWTISAFVTPGNMKFVLLHDSKNDDGIKAFFLDVWELYVKTMLNPFHTAYTPIRSSTFDGRVRASAKKHL